MNNTKENFENILWEDAELESIFIDYDNFVIKINQSNGLQKEIICQGYICYENQSFWDEIIIESAELKDEDPFLSEAIASLKNKLGKNFSNSGNDLRNKKDWKLLNIVLIDGNEIKIVFSALSLK